MLRLATETIWGLLPKERKFGCMFVVSLKAIVVDFSSDAGDDL